MDGAQQLYQSTRPLIVCAFGLLLLASFLAQRLKGATA